MPDWCQVTLRRGGVEVALDESTFTMLMHFRGTKPAEVEIKQGWQRYSELALLAAATGDLEIEIVTPTETGQFVPSIIKSWDVLRVKDGPGDACTLELIEARRELAWHTCTQDINLKRWTGYVPGTAGYESGGGQNDASKAIDTPWTLKQALQAISALPPLKDKMADGAFDDVPDTAIRDDIFLAGLQMDGAIDIVEQVTGIDLSMEPSTRKYTWKPRQDGSGRISTDWYTHSWLIWAGWVDKVAVRTGIPKKIIGQYRRRVTLHVMDKTTYDNDPSTRRDQGLADLPGVPTALLEQVYDFAGHWLTLEDMLEAAGYPRTAIDEGGIAGNIMEDNWVETQLFYGRRPDTVDKGIDAIVRKAIKDGWRKFYALRFINKQGKDLWGGFSGVELGEQNEGGGFRAGQVFCDWTEILPKAEEDEFAIAGLKLFRMVLKHMQGVPYPESPVEDVPFKWTGYDGSRFSTFTVAPFKLEWEDDRLGIVKLVADKGRIRGSTGFVGQPTKSSLKAISTGVGKTSKATDADQREVEAAGIDAQATNAVRGLQFLSQYSIDAYISAIMEAPQGIEGIGKRFLDLELEGPPGGDVEAIRLPVPDSPVAISGAGDGDGDRPRNFAEIGADLERRYFDLVDELTAKAQGPGETLDVHRIIPMNMPAEMVASELKVNENVITALVEVGNEGTTHGRQRLAAKREAGRRFKLAGKEDG